MQRSPRCRIVLALASLTACGAPSPSLVAVPADAAGGAPTEQPSSALRDAATKLVGSAPERWAATCAVVQSLAAEAPPTATARALLDALADDPDGAGVQPTLAVLGNLDLPATRNALLARATATDPVAPHAADAALALGRGSPDPAMVAPLRRLVDDPAAPRTLRTGAAATLLDWHQPQLAAPFLHAVLLGGTPEGQDGMRRFGLADDSRWALERAIVIAAIDRWSGEPGAYDLDPDLPWPLLRQRADRFLDDALRTRR